MTGLERYCPDYNTKYKIVTKESVKRLNFVPAQFDVVEAANYVYSCPKYGVMGRLEMEPSILKGSVAPSFLVADIMKEKYENGMLLACQERKFACYDL